MLNGVQPQWFRAKIKLMKTRAGEKRGLYVSYNEKRNGDFAEAVKISKKPGGLTWLDKSRRKPEKLNYPTDIFIRLVGKECYFHGDLVSIELADNLPPNFVEGERNHRPLAWRNKDAEVPNKDFKTVFRIQSLRKVSRPPEVKGLRPPQSPVYLPK